MTRQQAKELLPIITAFAEGKIIEYKHKNLKPSSFGTPSEWTEHQEDFKFDTITFMYRIKPYPREFWIHKDPDGMMFVFTYRAYPDDIHVIEQLPS